MPNALEIHDLSTKLTLPEDYACAEKNITPNAVQAFVFDEYARVKSSLVWGKKSPHQDSEQIDQHSTYCSFKKSFVERMRNDKTQATSLTGASKL